MSYVSHVEPRKTLKNALTCVVKNAQPFPCARFAPVKKITREYTHHELGRDIGRSV